MEQQPFHLEARGSGPPHVLERIRAFAGNLITEAGTESLNLQIGDIAGPAATPEPDTRLNPDYVVYVSPGQGEEALVPVVTRISMDRFRDQEATDLSTRIVTRAWNALRRYYSDAEDQSAAIMYGSELIGIRAHAWDQVIERIADHDLSYVSREGPTQDFLTRLGRALITRPDDTP